MDRHSRVRCAGIVPPFLLQHLAASGEAHLADHARRTLLHDSVLRTRPARPAAPPQTVAPGPPALHRTVHDAHHGSTLPGAVVRDEGDPASSDDAVNEAYDGLGATWRLYEDVFGRNSIDDHGLPLVASVHYERGYDNAFWNGAQMVFGDGDGTIFRGFTRSLDVIGHELTHGVTESTAGLRYQGQSGALNESVSDVFGSLVRQRALEQDAADADWLIGADLLAPGVHGVALRSMKAPGTAYDDPRLGKDPQPADMAGYVDTTDDNGGVHINSGIPNRAFFLVATAIGGPAWGAPGRIWYDVLTGSSIRPDCDFATFAGLTVAAAAARYGKASKEATAVADAWRAVGVVSASSTTKKGADTAEKGADTAEKAADTTEKGADTTEKGADTTEKGADTTKKGADTTEKGADTTEKGADTTKLVEPADTTKEGADTTEKGADTTEEGADTTKLVEPAETTGAEDLTVRRTGGFGGLVRERTLRLDELPDEDASRWRELLADDRLARLAGGPTHPDAFCYGVRCDAVRLDVTVPEPALEPELRDLLERTLAP